jgi:hypothetical protein
LRTCWFLIEVLSLAEQLLPVLLVVISSCFRICDDQCLSVILEDDGPANLRLVKLRLVVPKFAPYIALWSKFDLLGKYSPSLL